jgi:hypothetical protein
MRKQKPPKSGGTADLFATEKKGDGRQVVRVIINRKLERDGDGNQVVTPQRIYQLEIQIDRFCLVSAWMCDGGKNEVSKGAALELVRALGVCKRCPVPVEEREQDGPWITIQER